MAFANFDDFPGFILQHGMISFIFPEDECPAEIAACFSLEGAFAACGEKEMTKRTFTGLPGRSKDEVAADKSPDFKLPPADAGLRAKRPPLAFTAEPDFYAFGIVEGPAFRLLPGLVGRFFGSPEGPNAEKGILRLFKVFTLSGCEYFGDHSHSLLPGRSAGRCKPDQVIARQVNLFFRLSFRLSYPPRH